MDHKTQQFLHSPHETDKQRQATLQINLYGKSSQQVRQARMNLLRKSLQNPTKSHTVINRAMGSQAAIRTHGSNQALQLHAAVIHYCPKDLQCVGENKTFETIAKKIVATTFCK